MSQPKLFEDTFEVKDIDKDGKKFDKGARANNGPNAGIDASER